MKLSAKYIMAVGVLALLSSCAGYNEISENDVYMQKPTALNLNEDESDLTSYNAFLAQQEGKIKPENADPRFTNRNQLSQPMFITGISGFGMGYRPGIYNRFNYGYMNDPFYRNSLFYGGNGTIMACNNPYGFNYYPGYYNPYGYNNFYGYPHPYDPYGMNTLGYWPYGGNTYYGGNANSGFYNGYNNSYNSDIYNKPGATNGGSVHYGHYSGITGSSNRNYKKPDGSTGTYTPSLAQNYNGKMNSADHKYSKNVVKKPAKNQFESRGYSRIDKSNSTISHVGGVTPVQNTTNGARRSNVMHTSYQPRYSRNIQGSVSHRPVRRSTSFTNRRSSGSVSTTRSSSRSTSSPSSRRSTFSTSSSPSYSRRTPSRSYTPSRSSSGSSYSHRSSSSQSTSSSSSHARRR